MDHTGRSRSIHSFTPNLGYDPLKDFAAVALTSYVPHALILSNKIQAKTMTELVAQSKKAAVTIATSGIGSATHMTLERTKLKPPMGYHYYATVAADDLDAIVAYLRTVPAKE